MSKHRWSGRKKTAPDAARLPRRGVEVRAAVHLNPLIVGMRIAHCTILVFPPSDDVLSHLKVQQGECDCRGYSGGVGEKTRVRPSRHDAYEGEEEGEGQGPSVRRRMADGGLGSGSAVVGSSLGVALPPR